MYNCTHCGTKVTLEKRAHICKAVRSEKGQMTDSLVVYQPAKGQSDSKQALVPGYMKRFGSKPAK